MIEFLSPSKSETTLDKQNRANVSEGFDLNSLWHVSGNLCPHWAATKLRRAQGCARSLCVAMMAMTLSACGCSIFSQSTGCQVKDVGLVAVLLPVIAVDRVSESVGDGHRQREQRRLILAGDPPATIQCMLSCAGYSHLVDRDELVQLSVQHIIAWWDTNPEPDQLPLLIDAHLLQGEFIVKRNPVEAARHWRRGAQLAADVHITHARALVLADGYDYIHQSDLDKWAAELEEQLLVLRYRGLDGEAADTSVLRVNCHPVSAWPPAWMNSNDSIYRLEQACSSAYIDVFEIIPPNGKPTVTPLISG